MALDTYAGLWNQVLGYAPSLSAPLAQNFVTNSFRQIAERRRWSWLIRYGEFLLPAVYNTGTVTLTRGLTTVTGLLTVWTADMVGLQFRLGSGTPIYTIATFNSPTSIDLDLQWGGDSVSGQQYQIYAAYRTAPSDFHAFLTVWDPRQNWQLWLNYSQKDLNAWDAMRANSGIPWVVVPRTYDTSAPPLPQYEIWPHVLSQYVVPFLYEARATDLSDAGANLPRYIRGDVILEMALAKAARWPGASAENPNPYFSLQLAREHDARSEYMIAEMERQDDEVMLQDLEYASSLPFAPSPIMPDANWLQRHALL